MEKKYYVTTDDDKKTIDLKKTKVNTDHGDAIINKEHEDGSLKVDIKNEKDEEQVIL